MHVAWNTAIHFHTRHPKHAMSIPHLFVSVFVGFAQSSFFPRFSLVATRFCCLSFCSFRKRKFTKPNQLINWFKRHPHDGSPFNSNRRRNGTRPPSFAAFESVVGDVVRFHSTFAAAKININVS